MNFLFGTVASLFLAMSLAALLNLRWVRRLPRLNILSAASSEPAVRCSVILAARDEEDRVESTIRRLLSQTGVSVEIIAVDDRSSDRTGDILARLAKQDARVKAIRVDSLPEGWLGKCHACHVGATHASADWLLFTDADCWLKPDLILRAIQAAEAEQADHVTLMPGVAQTSPALRAWHLLFLISILGWMAGANRNKPKAYVGIGAFNLVRSSAYQQCGGYEALRLTILDDVKLGLLLRRAGKRTRGFLGGDDVECHWGTNLRSMIKIMEKNYFAALDYRLSVVLAGTLFTIVMLCALALGLTSGTPLGISAALSPMTLILPASLLARRVGWPWFSGLGVPFMIPVFLYALLNSTFVTLRQGGIRWRETFYPLKQLRAGGVK
jgi:cellulose synthase/poly-beta-1,6-N-acetylglucosamine synthase-like glycosyltransferase